MPCNYYRQGDYFRQRGGGFQRVVRAAPHIGVVFRMGRPGGVKTRVRRHYPPAHPPVTASANIRCDDSTVGIATGVLV